MKKISELMIAAIKEDELFFKERNWVPSVHHRKRNKFYIGVNDENMRVYLIIARSHHYALEKLRSIEGVAPKSENVHIPFEIIFPNFCKKIDDIDTLDNTLSAIKLRATKCGPYDYGYYYEILSSNLWSDIIRLLHYNDIENIIVDKNTVFYFTNIALETGYLDYKVKNEYHPYGSFDIKIDIEEKQLSMKYERRIPLSRIITTTTKKDL